MDYDVRRYFPYLGYETFDFAVPVQTRGDVYSRYQVRVAEMRESVKICRQALERITPTGRLRDRRSADHAAAQGSRIRKWKRSFSTS